MKLILLGVSEAMLPLLFSLRDSDRYRVLGWYDSNSHESKLRELFPSGKRFETAEELSRSASDAAVVVADGGDPEARESLLRDLARDGIPLILMQPACSAIFAVELDMIQRDTGAPMIPMHSASLHPAMNLMAKWAQNEDSPVGHVEQIVMERATRDRSDESVRATLARDALLLRRLVGDFQRVGALQSTAAKSLANLSVHLTGVSNAIARWSVSPVDQSPGATLSLVGDDGRITLRMPDEGDWQLSATTPDLIEALPPHDSAAALVEHLEHGLNNEQIAPCWEDAFRAIDLADLASESVRRGKTLSINNERLTEEDTFKSMMAAGGCLIILILPFLLLLVSLVDGLQIPYTKKVVIEAQANRRTLDLPPDLESLDYLELAESGKSLRILTSDELFDEFGIQATGTPEAYSVNRGDVTLAPIPAQRCSITVRYKGSFSIWRGWPLLLLLPIVFFLMLQLLKLVFPKPTASGEATAQCHLL